MEGVSVGLRKVAEAVERDSARTPAVASDAVVKRVDKRVKPFRERDFQGAAAA